MDLPPNIGEVIGRLMSDPNVMGAIRNLNIPSNEGDMPPKNGDGTPKQQTQQAPSSQQSQPSSNRRSLLKALEPYLSPDRRSKLDGIVRVIELVEYARKME